jgi:hypothetical protein
MRKVGLMAGLALVAIACATGADMVGEIMDSGVPDADAQTGECPCEAGPQGEPGPQGLPGVGAVVWKDADGATVDRVVGIEDRYYFDLDGNVWALTPADDLTVTQTNVGGTYPAYTSPDCTGTAYILAGTSPPDFPPPRMTFTTEFDPDTIRVRPDDSAIQVVEWCSSITDTGCIEINEGACRPGYFAISADDSVPETPLSIPTLSHTRPSHPELP